MCQFIYRFFFSNFISKFCFVMNQKIIAFEIINDVIQQRISWFFDHVDLDVNCIDEVILRQFCWSFQSFRKFLFNAIISFFFIEFSVRSFKIFVFDKRLIVLKTFIDRIQIFWRIFFRLTLILIQLTDCFDFKRWGQFSNKWINPQTYFLLTYHCW